MKLPGEILGIVCFKPWGAKKLNMSYKFYAVTEPLGN